MKNLLRKLIKVLFGIIIPGIIIMYTACSFFTVPVKILLIIIFTIQAILWFGIMKDVRLMPKMNITYYKGICVGAYYENKRVSIVLPFIYVELN
jgi:hypothetical protein